MRALLRHPARELAVWPVVLLATLGFGLVHPVAGLADRSGRVAHGVVRLWARLTLWLAGVDVTVEGAERVPEGPVVFVSNHVSALDIPVVFGYLPAEFRVIHKKSLWFVPVVGWVLYWGGHIGIDRGKAFRARRSLHAAADRIRRGTSVVVFPEGTRSPDGRVGLFKRGSFVLAINAGVPVVPVALAGLAALVPGGLTSLRPGRVSLRIGAAVPTAGCSPDEAETLAEQIRETICSACGDAA